MGTVSAAAGGVRAAPLEVCKCNGLLGDASLVVWVAVGRPPGAALQAGVCALLRAFQIDRSRRTAPLRLCGWRMAAAAAAVAQRQQQRGRSRSLQAVSNQLFNHRHSRSVQSINQQQR